MIAMAKPFTCDSPWRYLFLSVDECATCLFVHTRRNQIPGTGLWATVWFLGTELESSGRTRALTH